MSYPFLSATNSRAESHTSEDIDGGEGERREKKLRIKRVINGYIVETRGGFITVKHWIVYDRLGERRGIYFRFREAKEACLLNDFSKGYQGNLY